MSNRIFFDKITLLLSALVFCGSAHAGKTDLSSVPLSTYYAPSSVDVKPNILLVLDDSGSMDWDAMPDQAAWYLSYNTEYRPRNYNSAVDSGMPAYMRYNSAFNGLAYNPAITYLPPVTYNADGSLNTTTYPSMTGVSTATGGDSSASSAARNWKAVKNNAFSGTAASNLNDNAYAYVVVPGEYCDKPDLRTCVAASAQTSSYPYPAKFRWCTSEALTTCRATWDSNNAYPRMPAPRTATITVSGITSTAVSGITVDGLQILTAATSSSNDSTVVATRLRDGINACTNRISGNCTVVGFWATVSGSVVTIYAPGTSSTSPLVTLSSGSMGFATTAFARSPIPLANWLSTTFTTQSSAAIPGENLRHTITSSVTSYPYPGSAQKHLYRTDCAGSTCSYEEEMTNYANWWTYYRTRMQMMKTSTSIAFSKIDTASDIAANQSRFRVGYMTLNNNGGSDFINFGEFKTSQKSSWYAKLFSADPNNGTPLRSALSTAGRLYAGRYNGTSLNGVTVTDPLQYSCQQNFTILSTDGFWNGNSGTKLDGSTSVGNQDGAMPPPYNDGGVATIQESTSTLQTRNVTQWAQKGTLQQQTSQLQQQTSQLQAQTSSPQESTAQLLASTSTLQAMVSYQLQTRTSSNNGTSWTAWSNTTSCTWDTSGSTRRQCQYIAIATPAWTNASSCAPHARDTSSSNNSVWSPQMACQYTAWTTPSSVSSCTPVAQSSGTGTWNNATARQCSYSAWTVPSSVTSCTPATPSSGTGNWTVATAKQCSYTTWSAWGNVSSCTAVPQATSGTYGLARQCQYADWTAPVDALSCSPVTRSAASPYSVGLAVNCPSRVLLPFADAGACAVTTIPDASGRTTQCQYRFDALAPTQTCSPVYTTGDYSNTFVYGGCTTTAGSWATASSCEASSNWNVSGNKTQCQYTPWSSWTTVSNCTSIDQSTGTSYTVGTARRCQTTSVTGGYSNTLADVAAYYYNTDLRNSSQTGVDTTGTCTGPIIAPATTANDLCVNNVPPNGRDAASWQHMTTFTLGLGAQGKMQFSPNYWTDTSGDFYSVKNKQTADPTNGVCSWLSSGQTCVWPQPSADSPANIDDLWHAAINGRGSYFSATDPGSLASGLTSTLKAIVDTPRPGTSAAAASSNPNISAGDNLVFSSYYKSVDWYGELYRQRFDTVNKQLSAGLDWAAASLLDCAVTPWRALNAYVKGNAYRNGTTCYLVMNDYVSEASFGSTDTDNTALVTTVPAACGTAWEAARNYIPGNIYSYSGTCYFVISNYTSGQSFGSVDIQNTNVSTVVGTPTSRTVYTKVGSALASFSWNNLTTTQKTYFTKPYLSYVAASGSTPASGLSQFCTPAGTSCLSATAQDSTTVAAGGAAGEALVNYLRGDRSNEGGFFRGRKHVLGDIVSSEARYVKTPMFDYSDAGYSQYKTLQSSRAGMVYVAANDGMLHAFDANTGQEKWAYVPELVLPNLYKLADQNYSQNHQYLVDGTPEVGDVCPTAPTTPCSASQWRTILVGGLNDGGKGYYALDITDPASPALLWEFSGSHMGYSYGNPRITKLQSGQWVVMLTSGYNNDDGNGYLYILDAYSGSAVRTMSTGAGSAATPSGLAKIAAHSRTSTTNNTTSAVYGGDMFGNLWRFDVNDANTTSAQLLVSFKDAAGVAQPVTARPSVTTISTSGGTFPVVFVGTGSYLGVSDVSSGQFQAMYAVKDNGGAAAYANPRSDGSNFIQQTMTADTCSAADANAGACVQGATVRKIASSTAVDWSTKNGWYLDLLTAGERASTDPSLAIGSLVFTSITPNNATAQACGQAGSDTTASFFYTVDYRTGGAVPGTSGIVGSSLGNVIATRPVLIRLEDGSVTALIRTSGGSSSGGGAASVSPGVVGGYTPVQREDGSSQTPRVPTAPTGGSTRRVSWRELTTP